MHKKQWQNFSEPHVLSRSCMFNLTVIQLQTSSISREITGSYFDNPLYVWLITQLLIKNRTLINKNSHYTLYIFKKQQIIYLKLQPDSVCFKNNLDTIH